MEQLRIGHQSLVVSHRALFLDYSLFTIYINDINVGLNTFIGKFADDTKIGNSVISDRDRRSLQDDLNKISAWSARWEMPFNVKKCDILQVGRRNLKYDYEMSG